MSFALGIETTCDETSAAVVTDGRWVLSNVVRTQAALHQKYGGVVPELAARAHIELIDEIISLALGDAGITGPHLDVIGVAHTPGLVGCLLVGVSAAKGLAFAWDKQLVGVNHVAAHLYAAALYEKVGPVGDAWAAGDTWPALGLVISGGHTTLYRMASPRDLIKIGHTIDDAVGEAFDKVAAILQLGYPGGPQIDALAKRGNPEAIKFPLTLLGRESLDFSFSGLKTAVLYHVCGVGGKQRDASTLSPQERADVAASFQRTATDILITKCRRALGQGEYRSLVAGGGVCANSAIRNGLQQLGREYNIPVLLPALQFWQHNGAMIAGMADELYRSGMRSDLCLRVVATS